MTKIFSRFIIAFILFTSTAVPAFAQTQFSILPYTEKTPEECKIILDQYEKDGKIPSAQMSADAKQFQDVGKQLDEADKKLAEAEKAKADIEKQRGELGKKYKDSGCVGFSENSPNALECKKMVLNELELKDKQTAAEANVKTADDAMNKASNEYDALKEKNGFKDEADAKLKGDVRGNLLGCAIKTGRITLSMIPHFITYFANFLLGMAGLIAVLFVVLGGYRYVIGGLTEDKEKGKQTIMHALMGFGLSLLAWAIVNIVMAAVTG